MREGANRYLFGEWSDGTKPLSIEDANRLCNLAESRREALRNYPLEKVLRLFEKLGNLWASPEFPARLEMENRLPRETGFSPEMIRIGMDELVWTLNPDLLRKKVQIELKGLTSAGSGDFNWNTRTHVRWNPLGIILHILSGNVFLVGIGSLVEGMITGNVSILKMSGERIFLNRFIETLNEIDEDGVVSRSLAVIDYESNRLDIIEELKKRVDGIVVWGGEQAVRAYRENIPARTRFIVFGPKLSFAVVTEKGLLDEGLEIASRKIAEDVAIWDQNACTAPQLCFVEGEKNARKMVESLALSLKAVAKSLPPGLAETPTAVEIQKMRGVFEIAEARGEGMVRYSQGNVDWTVVLDRSTLIEPSPLHRTLRVVPFNRAEVIFDEAEKLRGYVQTVGLLCSSGERFPYFDRLCAAGALRIMELGKMAGGEIDDPHDGSYDLPQYGNFIYGRYPQLKSTLHPVDQWTRERLDQEINERLNTLIHHARKSPFYGKRLQGIDILSTADLEKIAILTRNDMEANIPPGGMGLSTGPLTGGYVARSGGSTGEPKFSVYDGRDWQELVQHAVRVFRSAGLEPGDKVANLMLAGDLYGSFVSFDHVNASLGMMSFAFTGHTDPKLFAKVWREFRFNVIEGIPIFITSTLREAVKTEPNLRIEKILYGGTPISTYDRQWLMEVMGVKRIISIIGANDGGQIAFQCSHMSGRLHHTVDDFNYIEIVDDEGRRLPDKEPGRILVTGLRKFAFPLIRYEIGDRGRIVPGPCACGRNNRLLEYLGRADDIVCVGVMNVRYDDLLNTLEGFPVSCMQLVIRSSEKGDQVILKVESSEPGSESLRSRMVQAVLDREPKMSQSLMDGTLASVDVEVLKEGGIPRNSISGKLKRIQDERK